MLNPFLVPGKKCRRSPGRCLKDSCRPCLLLVNGGEYKPDAQSDSLCEEAGIFLRAAYVLLRRTENVPRETYEIRMKIVKMTAFHIICLKTTVAQRLFIHYNRNSAVLQVRSGEIDYTFFALPRERSGGRVSWKGLKPRAFRGPLPCW